jgi:hypothetical protein
MSIFDVVVNTDDLVVLGPPDVIDLAISIGQQGNRGATFYAGAGNPNDSVVSQNIFGTIITPVAGDIFINTALGSEYGWLYIYNPKIVGNQWDQVLKLQQPFYAIEEQITFTAGSATVAIPLANILPSGVTESDPDKYIVTLTPKASDPVILTVNSKSIVSTNLSISLEAIKYSSASWSALNETINIYVHIAVV